MAHSKADQLLELNLHYYRTLCSSFTRSNTIGEESAMLCLLESETALTSGELSRRLELTSGRMANILKALEKKRYILRTADTEDRRRVLVSLTSEGRAHISQLRKELLRDLDRIANQLGAGDTDALIALMQRFLDCMKG